MNINASLLGDMARVEFSMQGINNNVTLQQTDKTIIINFNQQINADPSILLNLAPGYITDAVLSKDLSSIIISTAKPYPLNNLLLRNNFFLELVGTPSTNLKNIKPDADINPEMDFFQLQKNNQNLENLPTVNERVYIRKEFLEPQPVLDLGINSEKNKTVFNFNWDKKVDFKLSDNKNGLNLSFDANVDIDNNDVKSLLVSELKQFNAKNNENKLSIFIPIPKNYMSSIIEQGNNVSVILDKKQIPVKAAVKKAVVATKKSTAKKSDVTVKAQVEKVATTKTTKTSNKTAIETSSGSDTKTENTKKIEKVVTESKTNEVAKTTEIADIPPVTHEKIHISDNLPITADDAEVMTIGSRTETIDEDDDSRSFSLSFPWSRDTAAALFEKQGYWWIVFDRKAEIDFSLLKRLGGDVVHEIVQLPNNSATVIRMIIDAGYNPTVRKEGLLWIMDIVGRETGPTINLDVQPIKDRVNNRLFIASNKVGVIQRISDPLFGDSFTVVPVYGLGWGIAKEHSYPNLVLPKTIQGVVIEPISSDIIVKTNNSGIEISKVSGGLSLSSDAMVMAEEDINYTMEALDRLFDLKAFEKETYDEFHELLPNFLARSTVGSNKQRNLQRLNLAKFYLANGFTAEALSILKLVESDDYDLSQTPTFLAIRGMANVLFNRPDKAIENLNREDFDDSDMAKVWLAAAYAQKDNFSPAQFNVFKKYQKAISLLPYDTRAEIALLAAETAYSQQDDATMDSFLEMLTPEKNNPYQQAAYDYYKGINLEALAAFKEAGEHLTKAKDSPSQLYHALGSVALAKLAFKLDMIDINELARRLERHRYAWRGDDIEYNTMLDLVNIYMENEKYPEALRKMREIIKAFPKHKKTAEIKNLAIKTFEDLYFNDKSSKIDPVTAIALFNEFTDLIPNNNTGNEMIKKLADRMVSVDLLNNAAKLLQNQMDNPLLMGKQRSEIGTRLALIYLLENQSENAISALDESIFFPISGTLDDHRTIIRAKALANMGQVDEAIKLLEIDNSPNSQKLKIDIYWAKKDWEKVSDAIKPLIKKPMIGKPISNEQAQLLIAWATAMRLGGNETGLNRLRENFITYMKDTSFYEPFNIITSSSFEAIDVNNLTKEIKSAENFASFLNGYTKDLKDNNLSDIVK